MATRAWSSSSYKRDALFFFQVALGKREVFGSCFLVGFCFFFFCSFHVHESKKLNNTMLSWFCFNTDRSFICCNYVELQTSISFLSLELAVSFFLALAIKPFTKIRANYITACPNVPRKPRNWKPLHSLLASELKNMKCENVCLFLWCPYLTSLQTFPITKDNAELIVWL